MTSEERVPEPLPEDKDGSPSLFSDLADLVLPRLPPYEFSLYFLLLSMATTAGTDTVHLGKRSISKALGKGTRSSGGNIQHIAESCRRSPPRASSQ